MFSFMKNKTQVLLIFGFTHNFYGLFLLLFLYVSGYSLSFFFFSPAVPQVVHETEK